MKTVEFRLTDSVYEKWLEYKKEHNFTENGDSGALYKLQRLSDILREKF